VDAARLRSGARHCRELARTARDELSRRQLNDIADELDADAKRMEVEEFRPSMPGPRPPSKGRTGGHSISFPGRLTLLAP
jgi:hypothetical protein